ncbi:hypothetical protein C3Y87_20530 [Carbonactinospora thermoautotrophica]|uniref:Kelch repeat-containing protein n=1 Tax=Carbonactinospora thermoautotrophica TaxID=1469144 RepID=UPI00099E5099|nr:kelch repeat-containing protein [Carbonactinospora thermoautotrophica]MCX9193723.1 hypothetical protein [Carbonactinospora thermoautotrophica]
MTSTSTRTVTGGPARTLPALVSRLRRLRPPRRRSTAMWVGTGSLMLGRRGHAATLLPDGTVLVAGGSVGRLGVEDYTAGAEVFDPAAGMWTPVEPMAVDRTDHAMTRLADGRVLVTGGLSDHGNTVLDSAEIYDPVRRRWTPTGSMHWQRVGHTATLLFDGRVLVTGGYDKTLDTHLDTAEVFDPATGRWSVAATMSTPRSLASATLLPDGRVLVVGGYESGTPDGLRSCEVYDPRADAWSATAPLALARDTEETGGHRAVSLADGRVLVVGGYDTQLEIYTASCEIYDPATGRWQPAAAMGTPRGAAMGVVLADGSVVVAGGYNDQAGALASAERYFPEQDQWVPLQPMSAARGGYATLTPLSRHRLLAAGGDGTAPEFRPVASAETLRV